jgi:hypothetical protein
MSRANSLFLALWAPSTSCPHTDLLVPRGQLDEIFQPAILILIIWAKSHSRTVPFQRPQLPLDGGVNWPYITGYFPATGGASVPLPI